MAKDRFTVSTMTELIGYLDLDQDEKMTVVVETGKGDSTRVVAVDVVEVLKNCLGQKIALKLVDDEDKLE